ncbi:unnamed protein product [Closterium sp. NIES-65]|nr:unnamed protein product [Closterium sp. NIES-65]
MFPLVGRPFPCQTVFLVARAFPNHPRLPSGRICSPSRPRFPTLLTHPLVANADSRHTAFQIVTRAPLITLVDPHRPHSLSSLTLPPITLADPRCPCLPSSLARPVVALASQSLSLPLVISVWQKVHVVRSSLALGYDVVFTDRAIHWDANSHANGDLYAVRSNTHAHAQVLRLLDPLAQVMSVALSHSAAMLLPLVPAACCPRLPSHLSLSPSVSICAESLSLFYSLRSLSLPSTRSTCRPVYSPLPHLLPPSLLPASPLPPPCFLPPYAQLPPSLRPASPLPTPSFLPPSAQLPPFLRPASSLPPPSFLPPSAQLPPSLRPASSLPTTSFLPPSAQLPPSLSPASSLPPPSFLPPSAQLPPSLRPASSLPPPSFLPPSAQLPPSLRPASSLPPPSSPPSFCNASPIPLPCFPPPSVLLTPTLLEVRLTHQVSIRPPHMPLLSLYLTVFPVPPHVPLQSLPMCLSNPSPCASPIPPHVPLQSLPMCPSNPSPCASPIPQYRPLQSLPMCLSIFSPCGCAARRGDARATVGQRNRFVCKLSDHSPPPFLPPPNYLQTFLDYIHIRKEERDLSALASSTTVLVLWEVHP